MSDDVYVIPKPEHVTYEEIQALLSKAHQSNLKKGLLYATASQTVEKLKEKMKNSTCLVAILGDCIVGTITVEFRSLDYWYHHGKVAVLKLLGVDDMYRGRRIGSLLFEKAIDIAREKGIDVIVADSAEKNIALKKLALKHGFFVTDYCVYQANNFYSTVYVKWLNQCPHSSLYRFLRYQIKRMMVRIQYKPGKVKRI